VYAEWFRPNGIEHELEVAIPSPLSHTKTFLFDRGPGRDFTERDRTVLNVLQPHLVRLYELARLRSAAGEPDGGNGEPPLTAREREVLAYVRAGLTNAEVAQRLWLSPNTVRRHLENAYRKLGVHTRTAAVARLGERPRG
jgi:DNA-binding CsgD family transcriptional regulator